MRCEDEGLPLMESRLLSTEANSTIASTDRLQYMVKELVLLDYIEFTFIVTGLIS